MLNPMKTYWLPSSDTGRLIALSEHRLIYGLIKGYDKNHLLSNAKKGIFPEDIFSIPYSYIRSIENPEGKTYIRINYGQDSSEEIKTENEKVKDEVFYSLKTHFPTFTYSEQTPSIYRHGKPQFFAILILTGLFLWTLYLAINIEQGYEYEPQGSRVGIAGLALGMAQFGTTKIVMGYLF